MKKPYLMRIIEQRTRNVIVWADNRDAAMEGAERMCQNGIIDMTKDNHESREVFVQFKAEGYDFNIFEQFGRDEM